MTHFGINIVKRKYSLELQREEFALISTKPSLPVFEMLIRDNAYTNNDATEYSVSWCERYRKLCLENYDLNMRYFDLLDAEEFRRTIDSFLRKHPRFVEVTDLRSYTSKSGYYLMVLDKYKQAYIGKSENIRFRIHQHWTKVKQFDRILFPMYAVKESCFSIDFFRALDTTRIYVWQRPLADGIESMLVKEFPKKFSTNRIGGDITNAIDALVTLNIRKM